MKSKRGIISEYLPWIIIALAVLAILTITAFLMKEKGFSLISQLGNLFRGK